MKLQLSHKHWSSKEMMDISTCYDKPTQDFDDVDSFDWDDISSNSDSENGSDLDEYTSSVESSSSDATEE
ncbi:hypothetical protein CEXT_608291 [Caerostris extrusa]|uniref:Uncharacterized protein n=1 Tax=Caerostris extrusa TaxID=172846 RepID=A0AAV4T8J3_CAEEX|nr:hypothetical protein CEXT_608291 [Caerostris extrusa]